jgi:hypothetical protein
MAAPKTRPAPKQHTAVEQRTPLDGEGATPELFLHPDYRPQQDITIRNDRRPTMTAARLRFIRTLRSGGGMGVAGHVAHRFAQKSDRALRL